MVEEEMYEDMKSMRDFISYDYDDFMDFIVQENPDLIKTYCQKYHSQYYDFYTEE